MPAELRVGYPRFVAVEECLPPIAVVMSEAVLPLLLEFVLVLPPDKPFLKASLSCLDMDDDCLSAGIGAEDGDTAIGVRGLTSSVMDADDVAFRALRLDFLPSVSRICSTGSADSSAASASPGSGTTPAVKSASRVCPCS